MQLSLNDPNQFTLEGVKRLIASKDDSSHHQLIVTKQGVAFLSDGEASTEDVAFRFETWAAGNDYVGEAASRDEEWVSKIFEALKKNWPDPTDTFLDLY